MGITLVVVPYWWKTNKQWLISTILQRRPELNQRYHWVKDSKEEEVVQEQQGQRTYNHQENPP